jgi:hypothetical protein
MKFKWQVTRDYTWRDVWQVWRQTRELLPGEPMHGGVREYAPGFWETREEAQAAADRLTAEEGR